MLFNSISEGRVAIVPILPSLEKCIVVQCCFDNLMREILHSLFSHLPSAILTAYYRMLMCPNWPSRCIFYSVNLAIWLLAEVCKQVTYVWSQSTCRKKVYVQSLRAWKF